jgi:aminopeptidase N
MRIVILLLSMVSLTYAQNPPIEPGVSHELAKWRAARYSDVRYKLNLTLEKMSPVLKGTIEVRVVLRDAATPSSPPSEGGVDAALGGRGGSLIVLDWRKIRGHEEKSTVSNVSINGKALKNHPVGEAPTPLLRKEGSTERPLAFSEHNEHLIFHDGVIAGENVIKLDFTSPILTSGSAITRYVDKEDGAEYIYSLFVPSDASTAFPVFDQPDLKGKFEVLIDAPEGWLAVSNTSPTRNTDTVWVGGGGRSFNRFTFSRTKPISTYVFAFAAGPWQQMSEPGAVATGFLPLPASKNPVATAPGSDSRGHVFVRKSQLAKFQPHAAEVFRLNREGIKFLETYFDYKFPFPKYDIVLIPEFPFGGMEHAGATFLREDRVIFPQEPTKNDYITRANLIFHEAAHQWFGDTATMRWFDACG